MCCMNTSCTVCGKAVDPERIAALDEMGLPQVCIPCSEKITPEPIGFMDYAHKTAPDLVIVDRRNTEAVRKAQRSYRRAR